MQCIRCGAEHLQKGGKTRVGSQRWCCMKCGRVFTDRSTGAFKGSDYPDDLIALTVRTYLRYPLSYTHMVRWLADRGFTINQATVVRWVQRGKPLFADAASSERLPASRPWHVDEIRLILNGLPAYGYRAVNDVGEVLGCEAIGIR